MIGFGAQEILLLLILGGMFAAVVLVVVVLNRRGAGRDWVAELEAENRRIRDELDKKRGDA